MTFKDIAVNFSRGEWRKLEPFQKEIYKEVLLENCRHLEFLGKDTFSLWFSIKPGYLFGHYFWKKTIATVLAGHAGMIWLILKMGPENVLFRWVISKKESLLHWIGNVEDHFALIKTKPPPCSLQISVLLSVFDSIFSSLENQTLCVDADWLCSMENRHFSCFVFFLYEQAFQLPN